MRARPAEAMAWLVEATELSLAPPPPPLLLCSAAAADAVAVLSEPEFCRRPPLHNWSTSCSKPGVWHVRLGGNTQSRCFIVQCTDQSKSCPRQLAGALAQVLSSIVSPCAMCQDACLGGMLASGGPGNYPHREARKQESRSHRGWLGRGRGLGRSSLAPCPSATAAGRRSSQRGTPGRNT